MAFVFDPDKSASNRVKHGIDFIEAQRIWNDPRRLEIPGQFKDEDRTLVIGEIDGVVWTSCVTYRDTHVRIISVRRARYDEKEAYQDDESDHG